MGTNKRIFDRFEASMVSLTNMYNDTLERISSKPWFLQTTETGTDQTRPNQDVLSSVDGFERTIPIPMYVQSVAQIPQ